MEKLFVYSYFPENNAYECYPCRTIEGAMDVAINRIDNLTKTELMSYRNVEIPAALQDTINAVKEKNLNKAIASWEMHMNLMRGVKTLLHEIKEAELYQTTAVPNIFGDPPLAFNLRPAAVRVQDILPQLGNFVIPEPGHINLEGDEAVDAHDNQPVAVAEIEPF